MTELILLAHTEATHHLDHLVGGHFDSELSEKGRADAGRCAVRLRQMGLHQTPIVSSDLQRATQTARIVASFLGSEVSYQPLLREMSFGEAEGKPQAWLDERMRTQPDDNTATARMEHRIIATAESREQLAQRQAEFLKTLEEDKLIIVGHGFALSFLIAQWLNIPVEHCGWLEFKVSAGGISHLVETRPFGNRQLRLLNAREHLD